MTKKQYKEQTVSEMSRLGVYREEYDNIIDIYAGLLEQYEIMAREHKKQKYAATVNTASFDDGVKSNPIVRQLEALRKDILAYSDRLCLNPKALSGTDVKPTKKSALALALKELSG